MNQKFAVGDKLYTTGRNRKCKLVVVQVVLVEWLAEPQVYPGGVNGTTILDCVVDTGSMRVMADSRKLFANKADVR